MIKRTLSFGNPPYLKTEKGQMIIKEYKDIKRAKTHASIFPAF